eukprot:scaffold96422_cov65-Phaeocystis_antarctica.AAC.1
MGDVGGGWLERPRQWWSASGPAGKKQPAVGCRGQTVKRQHLAIKAEVKGRLEVPGTVAHCGGAAPGPSGKPGGQRPAVLSSPVVYLSSPRVASATGRCPPGFPEGPCTQALSSPRAMPVGHALTVPQHPHGDL